MKKSLLLIFAAIAINIIVSCHSTHAPERTYWKQEVFLVDSINIPNSLVFTYKCNYYVCDSSVFNQNDLITGDMEKIISSPYVYHTTLDAPMLCFPHYLLWDTVVDGDKVNMDFHDDIINLGFQWRGTITARSAVINKRSKERIEIVKLKRNPEFYKMFLMNIAYWDWAFVYNIWDECSSILKSKSPSNHYITIVFPGYKEYFKQDTTNL